MPAPPLLKRDWQNDRIYLVQFPRAGCIPSVSPFALKLETWLRITGLPYSNINNDFTKMSIKKQIPFIELNGRQIPDSNFCIEHLSELFKVDIDANLIAEEVAQARAFTVLLEESLRWVVVYNRAKNIKFFATVDGFIRHFTGIKKVVFRDIIMDQFKKKIWRKCYEQGIGRYTPAEVEKIAQKDLIALSTFLRDKHFFFGAKPTTLDATAFGHLTQIYYTPLGATPELKKFMDEKTPNLVEFICRMKTNYWSDWDELLKTLSLKAAN